MIPFWKRREVYMGFDSEAISDVRRALTAANVPFIQRSSADTVRSRMGAFGNNATSTALHYIYVHKNDADRAQAALAPLR